MDKEKIERAAVRAVEDYIDSFQIMKSYIFTNDKTPIWDGNIYLHNNNFKEKRTDENFFAKIPLQVKGTTNTTDKSYRIGREHLLAYKKERGTLFFLVQEDEKLKPIKIFYNLLSSEALDTLLEQNTQNIKIELNKIPENPNDFEKEIFEFARKRNGETLENPATKEIESLVSKFEEIEEYVEKIENSRKRNELKFLLQEIKELKNDDTVGWRDKFVYYLQNALDIAIDNIKDNKFIDLQFELGTYLHRLNQYHLEEDYYVNVLRAFRERAKDKPFIYNKADAAGTLNNLATLHSELNRSEEAEGEYKEALEIFRELVEDDPVAFKGLLAVTLNNLAVLHTELNRLVEAEAEYKEALEIYRKLAKENPNVNMGNVVDTLNNLAVLHKNLNRPGEAETGFMMALYIRRGLAKDNPSADMGDMAMVLNNLATLHKILNRPEEAEGEYKEALEIFRGLAKDNPSANMVNVAMVLNNLATLHKTLNRPVEAEEEYKEALGIRLELSINNNYSEDRFNDVAKTLYNLATLHSNLATLYWNTDCFGQAEEEFKTVLEAYRKLAEDNPAAYMCEVAVTLNDLAALHTEFNRYNEAEEEFEEALIIRRRLAEETPTAYMGYVALTLINLGTLHKNLNLLDKAEKEYNEALEIFKKLAMDNSTTYRSWVAMTLSYLAIIFAYQLNISNAIDTIEEAIALMPENDYFFSVKEMILQVNAITKELNKGKGI